MTGDAFESAEGVATPDSWPRLLEKKLNTEYGIEAQVLNFSITGWGPNQYASVISDYAPKFRPDIIIVGFFVNEFFDIKITNEDFQDSIGFQKSSQSSPESYMKLAHLRAWIKINIIDYLKERIRNKPNPAGYFFGCFKTLERKGYESMVANAALVEECLKTIVKTAQAIDARPLVVLVPSAVQVCGPDTMRYYPKCLDLSVSERFDLNQPQRLAKNMCEKLNLPYTDLRDPLRKVAKMGPYQPKNMHWTELGHDVVARHVAQYLYNNRYLRLREIDP